MHPEPSQALPLIGLMKHVARKLHLVEVHLVVLPPVVQFSSFSSPVITSTTGPCDRPAADSVAEKSCSCRPRFS